MSTQSSERPLPVFTLGDYLAKSRTWAGLSQQDMADRLLVSRTSVVNWENDHTYPTQRRLVAWAMATGVPLEWLQQGSVAAMDRVRPGIGSNTHNRWRTLLGVPRLPQRPEVALHAHWHNHKPLALALVAPLSAATVATAERGARSRTAPVSLIWDTNKGTLLTDTGPRQRGTTGTSC